MSALNYGTNSSYMAIYRDLGYFFTFLDDNLEFPGCELLNRGSLGRSSQEYRDLSAHAIVVIRSRDRANAYIYRFPRGGSMPYSRILIEQLELNRFRVRREVYWYCARHEEVVVVQYWSRERRRRGMV
jgi:hypothetical protein